MQMLNLHSNRLNKIISFLKLFRPEITNQGKPLNLNGFAQAIGHNLSENKLLADSGIFGEQDHLDSFYSLNDFLNAINNNKHIIGLGADVWFTPSLLLNKANIKASTSYVSWLTSLYVDIDGIKGIKEPEKALDKLYNACDKANIKRPDIVLHTSTNPTVHLQTFWLIDPIYIKNNDKELNNSRINWWEQSQVALCEALKETEPDLDIDTSINDPAKYMRLPYTINQKTGQMVTILDKNITDRRNLLSDYWLKNIRKRYIYNKSNRNNNYINNYKQNLLEHPQFKVLLQGVHKNIRNYSHYALAKACLGDGLSLKQAQDKLLEMNSLCQPPEREKKVLDVVKRAYEDGKGISISIVAETANTAIGENKFEPDPGILKSFNVVLDNCKPSKKKNKNIIDKIIKSIKQLKKFGYKKLLSQKELAQYAKVKYNTLKNYFSTIKKLLRKQGIYIVYDFKVQRYVFMTFSEWVNYIINLVKNDKSFFTIFPIITKKFSTTPLYISPIYSIKEDFGCNWPVRGSPI
ncbi:MAG: hypothetical protein ACOCRK_11000 [bacterium]